MDGGTRILSGELVFLDTGTRATINDTPGLAAASPMTHIEAMEVDTVPSHTLMLGGGYVGLEFAQAFQRLGSQVTVIERDTTLLPREDADIADP